MRLSWRLSQLVAGAVVPPLALASFLGFLQVDHERQTFRQGAIARTRAVMTAVDAEIRGNFTAIEALATARTLESGDLRAFHLDAQRALRSQSHWQNIILASPSGRQLVNARLPWGVPLPVTGQHDSIARVVATRQRAVGNVSVGQISRTYGIPLRIPVVQRGAVTYVLTAVVLPSSFQRLIEDQKLPPDWVSGLTDNAGHFVARIPLRSPADVASVDFMNAVHGSSEGYYRGRTVEGVDTFTAHKTSELSQWHVGLAIPSRQVNASEHRTAWMLMLGGLVTLGVALGSAYFVGRRISDPMTALARAASDMGEDGGVSGVPVGARVAEVREISQALIKASAAIRLRQETLEKEQAALKAADRAKDEFLAMLGHELRNPLGVIAMTSNVLRMTQGTGPSAERAHVVLDRQTRYMSRLIDDLLDVSRLTQGKIALRREPFDLAELVRTVVSTWQAARQRSDRVAVDVQSAWVDADRARMEQILTNLLDNADKFSPSSTVIRVSVTSAGRQAVLKVVDEGDGISPGLLPRIFEPFVQGATTPDRSRGGIGVGLTLVKRLTELHGGIVDARSEGPSKGAAFEVRLPAIDAVGSAQYAEASAPTGAKRNIVLIEDNDDARQMATQLLEGEGHRVSIFRDGESALCEIGKLRPDVVLVDIGLPRMSGYEVARSIRAGLLPPQTRLVAISGYGQPHDVRLAHEAGFDVHLTKPVSPEALRIALSGPAADRTGIAS